MLWLPTDNAAVLKLALALAFKATLPSEDAPSKNVTVPVGVAPVPSTVAVNTTVCPNADGLKLDVITTVSRASNAPMSDPSPPGALAIARLSKGRSRPR